MVVLGWGVWGVVVRCVGAVWRLAWGLGLGWGCCLARVCAFRVRVCVTRYARGGPYPCGPP